MANGNNTVRAFQHQTFYGARNHRCGGRKRDRMGNHFDIFGSLATILVGQVLRKEPPRRSPAQHDRAVHRRLPGPAVGRIPVRLAGRQGRPQVYLHHDARRHGARHRRDRVDSDLRADRPGRRVHPVRFADAPGSLPGRLLRRRHHRRRRARAGKPPRRRYRLAADLADPWNCGAARRDHRGPQLFLGEKVFNDWAWRISFLFSFLLVFVTMYTAPAELRGVAGLRGDQGQGAHEQECLARSLPQPPKSQICGDRHHRGVGRGRGGPYSSQFLGAVLSADGFQGGHARQFPHCGGNLGWSSAPRHSSCSAGCPISSAASR